MAWGRAKIVQIAEEESWFYAAERLYRAMQVVCTAERSIVAGGELLGHSLVIVFR